MEKLGFETRTFHMQSYRSTTELYPHLSHNAGYSSLLLFFNKAPDLFQKK